MSLRVLTAVFTAVLLVACGRSYAGAIDGDSFYATAIPSSPGTGLNASYFGPGVYSGGNNGGDNSADDTIAAGTPNATFISTKIDYPAGVSGSSYGDGNSLSSFLGVDAGTLNPSSAGTNTLGGQVITFSGYIALQAGTTNLQLGVDDGGYVNIGGIGYNSASQVVSNPGNHAFGFASGTVTVEKAGLYPIYVDYHELGGNTGVTFQYGSGAVVPESVLYRSVPEPSTVVLFGLGAISLFAVARRRRPA